MGRPAAADNAAMHARSPVARTTTRRAGGSYFNLDVVAADADGVGAHVVIGRRAGT